jgi:two-component system sensor histidine kinase TctE
MVVWPLSVTITFIVAQGIAQAPFDRNLAEGLNLIAGYLREANGRVTSRCVFGAKRSL